MLKFETAYADTRNGYVWRVRRDGVLMCVSCDTYATQAEAYEEGQNAMFLYFVL